jgi:hypothetical protein
MIGEDLSDFCFVRRQFLLSTGTIDRGNDVAGFPELFEVGIEGRATDGELFDKVLDRYAIIVGVHNSCA